jgi:hypothetical protein
MQKKAKKTKSKRILRWLKKVIHKDTLKLLLGRGDSSSSIKSRKKILTYLDSETF